MWKPEVKVHYNLERNIKGVLRQRKDELLNRQKTLPLEEHL